MVRNSSTVTAEVDVWVVRKSLKVTETTILECMGVVIVVYND